jgi:hypothetical protein
MPTNSLVSNIFYTSFVKMSSVQVNCTGHGILFMLILVDYRMCAM